MNNRHYYIIGYILLLSSCSKVVEMDMKQSNPQVVIEGILTDKATSQFVKVSRSIQFYDEGDSPVRDAIVRVISGNKQFNYTHNPLKIDSLEGYYFSDVPYAGQVGGVYSLDVNVGGVSFIAQDTMRHFTKIDNLSFRPAPNVSGDDKKEGRIYQLLLYVSDTQEETEDFYQLQFYRDNKLIFDPYEIYLYTDRILDSSDGFALPILFRENELAKVQIFSLGKEQYVFYTDLQSFLNNDGGMFSPPPANPRNSFSNGALGLWQVSSIDESSIKIEP